MPCIRLANSAAGPTCISKSGRSERTKYVYVFYQADNSSHLNRFRVPQLPGPCTLDKRRTRPSNNCIKRAKTSPDAVRTLSFHSTFPLILRRIHGAPADSTHSMPSSQLTTHGVYADTPSHIPRHPRPDVSYADVPGCARRIASTDAWCVWGQ